MDYSKNNDDETLSIKDLRKKMGEFLEDNDVKPYGFTHMKNEIKQHFSETVMISELQEAYNIDTLYSTASEIIDNFHQKSKQESDKRYLTETAAKLIKQDIKEMKQKNHTYSDFGDLSTETALQFLPQSLLQFLQIMICGTMADHKIASIGQAIMQATRPNAITAP